MAASVVAVVAPAWVAVVAAALAVVVAAAAVAQQAVGRDGRPAAPDGAVLVVASGSRLAAVPAA